MASLLEVLMRRDGMSEEEARELIEEMRECVREGEDPENVLHDWAGLEPDYMFDLIVLCEEKELGMTRAGFRVFAKRIAKMKEYLTAEQRERVIRDIMGVLADHNSNFNKELFLQEARRDYED